MPKVLDYLLQARQMISLLMSIRLQELLHGTVHLHQTTRVLLSSEEPSIILLTDIISKPLHVQTDHPSSEGITDGDGSVLPVSCGT